MFQTEITTFGVRTPPTVRGSSPQVLMVIGGWCCGGNALPCDRSIRPVRSCFYTEDVCVVGEVEACRLVS